MNPLLKDIIKENVKRNLAFVEPNVNKVDAAFNNMPAELLRDLKGIGAGSGVDFGTYSGQIYFSMLKVKAKDALMQSCLEKVLRMEDYSTSGRLIIER